jgi:hypothetical protein
MQEGIPNMKLDKAIVKRRVDLLAAVCCNDCNPPCCRLLQHGRPCCSLAGLVAAFVDSGRHL